MENDSRTETVSTPGTVTDDGTASFMELKIAVQCGLMVVIVFSNSLVICAIIRTPQLQTVTNYFVLSLAVADLLTGLVLPVNIAFLLDLFNTCMANVILMVLPCAVSISNLAMIAVDRHQAIIHPLHYQARVTPFRVRLAIGVCWIFCAIYSVTLPLYNQPARESSPGVCYISTSLESRTTMFFCIFFFIVVLIVTALYGQIFWVAYKQTVQVWAQTTESNSKTAKDFIKETKTTKTLCIVLAAFVFSWMPGQILFALHGVGMEANDVLQSIAVPLLVTNSCLNPLIYAWRNREFRLAFKRLFRREQ